MGFHVNARFIAGYGGKVAPPYSRYYMGGEDDIRGFDILTISPIAFIPTRHTSQRAEQRWHAARAEDREFRTDSIVHSPYADRSPCIS